MFCKLKSRVSCPLAEQSHPRLRQQVAQQHLMLLCRLMETPEQELQLLDLIPKLSRRPLQRCLPLERSQRRNLPKLVRR